MHDCPTFYQFNPFWIYMNTLLYVQLLLLAKLLFSSHFYLAYCLVYDWLDWLPTCCVRRRLRAYVLREYREIRTRVRAASSSTCWLTLLHDRVLSAVTLSITTWRRTIHGQDGDRLYSVVISTTRCWIHLHEQSTVFTTFCGWRYSDGGWKKSTILRAHYAGQSTFNSTVYVAFIVVQGRQAWKLDIRHSSSFRPSEVWFLLVARASSFFSLSLVVTDRCGTSDP